MGTRLHAGGLVAFTTLAVAALSQCSRRVQSAAHDDRIRTRRVVERDGG
jgi:hypothetical protein